MSYITVKDMNEVTHLIQTKNVVNLSFTEAEATFTLVCGPMLKEVVAKEILTDYRDWETDRKSTRLNSSHITRSRMPSSA